MANEFGKWTVVVWLFGALHEYLLQTDQSSVSGSVCTLSLRCGDDDACGR
jgi:hypothetical protein